MILDPDVSIPMDSLANWLERRARALADPDTGKVGSGRSELELIVGGTLRLGGDSARHVTYPPAGEDSGEWGGIVRIDHEGGG